MSQSTFASRKLLLHRFVSINDLQFDDEFVDFELRNDEKNANCLSNNNV